MERLTIRLLIATVAFLFTLGARADTTTDPREVYGRLLAPCCWNQTLDIHDSPVSSQLRAEIAERLSAGESALIIEDDMASRFGEKIRAVPRARDPRQSMALVVVSGLMLALLGLFWLGLRWSRGRPLSERSNLGDASAEPASTEYDAQLDRELSRAESVSH